MPSPDPRPFGGTAIARLVPATAGARGDAAGAGGRLASVVLRSLTQLNFRNLVTPKLEPCAGLTAIAGGNGAGKSNLLEACYLGLTGELPGGKIAENLRIGEEQGFVGAGLEHDDGHSTIEVGLAPGRKSLRLDGQAARVLDIAKVSAAVLITPEDADLVHGSPSLRRGYLDSLLGRLSPRYSVVSKAFGRVLEQRNAALRQGLPDADIDAWSDRFVEFGQEIDDLRERAVARIAELAAAAYQAIAGDGKQLSVALQRSNEGPLADALRESRGEERARGATVVGPHRSDLRLDLGGHSAQAYASRGEARTIALALRVAEFRLLEQRHAETPVLLLDDFSAELDLSRRGYLLQLVRAASQALVTGTEPPPEYDALMRIEAGVVSSGR
jgi:DNA replication and repair protein RecF